MLGIVTQTLEKMESSWHVVSLIPICFPLTENWESWLDVEEDVILFSFGVRRTNVADVIIIIEAVNVLR